MTLVDENPLEGLSAFSADRPLLLLTDFPPNAQGGGAVILRSLISPEERRRIVWVTLSNYEGASADSVVSLAPARRRSLLLDGTIRTSTLRQAIRKAARATGAAAAWVVAHGAATRVALGLLDVDLPLHVTVHDDPAWGHALLTRRYLLLAPILAHDLKRLLRVAQSIDVVSQPMAQRYRRLHDGEPSIVHRGLATPIEPARRYDRDLISLAVLGSTYGLNELKIVGEALERAGRRLGKPVRLIIIGGVDSARVRKAIPGSLSVEITGHLTEAEGIARLRDTFLLYLSYPFARRGKVLRTTSFPTKLSTYVMAARPMLLHMPRDGSVSFLGDMAPYATLWATRDPGDGEELIVRLWSDDGMRDSFHVAADHVRCQHFHLATNREALLTALNSLVS